MPPDGTLPAPCGIAPPRPRPAPLAVLLAAGLRHGGGLLAVVPLCVWWAVWRGGLSTTLVVPGLLWLAACAIVLRTSVRPRRPPRPALLAWAGLVVLAGLSLLSVAWADDRGSAVDGALRMALTAGAFGLIVLWPPTVRALGALVAAAPLIALAGLVSGLLGAIGDPFELIDGRLSAPTGYPNATAILALMGAVIAVVVSADATRRPLLRSWSLGLAAALLGGAVLPQSRSVLLLGVPIAILIVALAPARGRALVAGLAAAAAVVPVAPLLLHVRTAALAGEPHAATQGLVALAVLLVLGAAIGAGLRAAERRGIGRERGHRIAAGWQRRKATVVARLPRFHRWWPSRTTVLAGGFVLLLAATGFAVARGDLADLSNPNYTQIENSGTRFSAGLRSNRPDYWRVAVDLTVAHPLSGVGAANFGAAYLPHRRAASTPIAAHDSWLGTASELGLPGLLALLGAAVAATAGVVARLRRASGATRSVLLAASLPAVILALDATVDWTARFPLLTVLALGLVAAVLVAGGPADDPLGRSSAGESFGRSDAPAAASATASPEVARSLPSPAASAPTQPAAAPGRRPSPAAARLATTLAVALVIVTAAAVPSFLSARDSADAVAIAAASPGAAVRATQRASSLVPWDARPPLQQGVLEVASGNDGAAARSFVTAAGRDPSAWYPHLMLGVLAARRGDGATAARELAAVDRRVAFGRLTDRVRRAIAAGQPPDPGEIQQRAFRQGP